MNFYKPIDYLYYKIGTTYEWTNMTDSTYPSIAGMISAIQIFTILSIEDYFFDMQNRVKKIALLFGAFVTFLIFNFIRYNDKSYLILKEQWNIEALKVKWVCRSVLILYFTLSIFCMTQLVEL